MFGDGDLVIKHEDALNMLTEILFLEGQLKAVAEVCRDHHSVNVDGIQHIADSGGYRLEEIAQLILGSDGSGN